MRFHAPSLVLAVILGTALTTFVRADPVIDTCLQTGCATVFSTLAPCGGGATNSSLQQDTIYTPTASLGGCECNSVFYNAFSSCLSCIASQGNNSPEIQNQQDWVTNCENYGFNFTATPITNSTSGGDNNNGDNGKKGGLSTGAIIGIVVGAVVLIALIAGFCFLKNRKNQNKEKTEQPFEHATYSSPSAATGNATAAAGTAAGAVAAHEYHNSDYNNAYDQNQGHYNNQHNDGYPQGDYHNQDYNNQTQGTYANNLVSTSQGHYDNYYGAAPTTSQSDIRMQNLNNHASESFVPPPPINTNVRPASPTAAAAAALAASPRPSDTFPQSLRSKPAGWGDRNNENINSRRQELTSGLIVDPTLRNEKTEFDDGEDLEQPSTHRYGNYSPRGSMTPSPRATMQSYRDDLPQPNFEREPRRSQGSDRGSTTALNMVRGTNGLHGAHGGSGYDLSSSAIDYDSQGDDISPSPELARRRARAAELFSAESPRR
ncbi:hypothetical protein BGZ83_001631 [Gryganskiella cystojenkinii]|nr:hypothetical protein BGZ83_001631 [Gryganskiella cystojenkinii]